LDPDPHTTNVVHINVVKYSILSWRTGKFYTVSLKGLSYEIDFENVDEN
jgi:hypothetical protein